MKKKKQVDDRPVFSCRLGKDLQEFILKYDRLAEMSGRKPSMARALEQMVFDLGFRATGYNDANQDRATTKSKKQG